MNCIDSALLIPARFGAENVSTAMLHGLNGDTFYSTLNSAAARICFVAQSVVSAVALPFLILHTFFHGIYTLYAEGSWTTASINMGRLLGHTAIIPLGLLLAIAPVAPVQNALERLAAQIPNLLLMVPPDWRANPQAQGLLGLVQQIGLGAALQQGMQGVLPDALAGENGPQGLIGLAQQMGLGPDLQQGMHRAIPGALPGVLPGVLPGRNGPQDLFGGMGGMPDLRNDPEARAFLQALQQQMQQQPFGIA